jgi:ABC-type protease/lipase transport system fused ATPase/permease subunit
VITHRTTILDIVDVMMVLRNGLLEMLGPPGEIYQALQHQAAARRAS